MMGNRLQMRVSKLEAAVSRRNQYQSLTDKELEARFGEIIDPFLPEIVSHLAASDSPFDRDLAARITGRKYIEFSGFDQCTIDAMFSGWLRETSATDAP